MKMKKKLLNKNTLLKIIVFLVTVAAIVYFMPRDGKFNYQFEVNKPWRYGQLMATFDFPIYKEDAVVKRELDSIFTTFQPYYVLNKEIERDALKRLRDNYNSKLNRVFPSTDYVRYVERKLGDIYTSGIVSTESYNKLTKDSTLFIRVIDENKTVSSYLASDLFTVKDAYEYLLATGNSNIDIDILRKASLNDYIVPNLTEDETRTEAARQEIIDNHPMAVGGVQSGQKIVDRGEIVTRHTYNILESLRKESIKRSGTTVQRGLVLLGQIMYVGLLVLCFMIYLGLFRKKYYRQMGSLMLLFAMILFYCIITAVVASNGLFNVNIIPFAMLPMIIGVFLDSRTAFLTHAITILICSITVPFQYEFILLQLTAGLVAIYSLRELYQRSQLFKSTFMIVLTYAAIYFSYELIVENDLSKLNGQMYISFLINGILLLFTYPLLFMLEKAFGFTSNVTLVELSNINNTLLRRLSETAPGTFQHSMQVANLAAEAAIRIGANSQLVRTGAMYHDIGKLENPAFFTENQLGGVNPHKNLTFEQSAQIIIQHVKDGLKLAEKNNLPKAVKEFISTHHGRGKTKYFYISWMNEHPGEEPDDEMFTYPGPNPYSKEMAILMMADSVEAASRSLPEYTEQSISNLVDKIIDKQVEEGFFRRCPITFADIETVKEVFKEKLMTSYHTRISYPELKGGEAESAKPVGQ